MVEARFAPELRYTDRDIREDDSLMDLAVAYLNVYGGDFEPLVNAQREMVSSGELSTRTARVVLNCMRYDINVSDSLPEPKSPSLVVRKRQKVLTELQCANTEPHYTHWWRPSGEALHTPNPIAESVRCDGLPWKLTRERFQTKATVKRQFVAARTGKLVHRASGEAYVRWYPPPHEYGPAAFRELSVKLICKFPSWVHKPVLTDSIPDLKLWAESDLNRSLCLNGCFTEEELRAEYGDSFFDEE